MSNRQTRKEAARRHILSLFPRGAAVAEIGVWKGDFSATIMEDVAPRKLYLVDPWQTRCEQAYLDAWYGTRRNENMEEIYRKVMDRFTEAIGRGAISVVRGDSRSARAVVGEKELDALYIDGDHTYDAVREDLNFGLYAVRPGGLICGDDYMLGKWWGSGVVDAVNEFIGANGCLVEYFSEGQFALRVKD